MNNFKPTAALSIRQPWAWLILNGGKNIENRCWQTHFRGWFYIHAAKGMTRAEYAAAEAFAAEIKTELALPPLKELQRGGLVGIAKLGNCVRGSDSPWFVGPWGYVLEEVSAIEFKPCSGALGFFKPTL